MKRFIIMPCLVAMAVFILFGCDQHKVQQSSGSAKPSDTVKAISKAVSPDSLIIPGKGIGKILLNANADSLVQLFCKPDFADAAMGSALTTWYTNHDTAGYKISVFANHNIGSKDERISHIRKILVTNPGFKTAEGFNTGADLNSIKSHYLLRSGSNYIAKGKKIMVYEDASKGIAFEIDSASNKCVAIVIHRPNDTGATYINMH
jgi:hypothetical protein